MNRFLLPPILAAALAAGGCARPGVSRLVPAAGPEEPDLRVRRGDLEGRVLLTGELRAVHAESVVVPRVPRYQTSIRWMEADGAVVKAGQKVVEFDNSSFASDLEEKRLALTQATTELEQKKAEAAGLLAQRELEVVQKRIALEKASADASVPESLLARRDYQERVLALEKARLESAKAEEALRAARRSVEEEETQRGIAIDKARREIDLAESSLGALVQSAPRDGILVVSNSWDGRKLQIGDPAWVGMTVMEIPDLGEMEVEAALSDVDDGRIRAGMPATCTVDAYADRPIRGAVKEISPIATESRRGGSRRAFRVIVSLEASDPARLRPGMSVKVEVGTGAEKGVLLAPRAALSLDGRTVRALLADGEEREVRLGPCGALECVVRSGLSEGERLGSRG
jgi:HlyD family secretion protein